MNNITVTVANKVAALTSNTVIVCNNGDYQITFTFDSEWEEFSAKTARFAYGNSYQDVLFDGNVCTVPPIPRATSVKVGVFAGTTLHTTTGAYIPCQYSILCESSNGTPAAPSTDVYDQIVAELGDKIDEPTTEGTAGQVLTTDGEGGRTWSSAAGGVTSVNGETGVVVLDAADVGAQAAEAGKGLSTEDYTTAEKTKLSGIAEGAEVNVQSDWNAADGDAAILNKPTIIAMSSQTVTIAVADWNGGTTVTKSVTGVTADCVVFCDSSDATVDCTAQGAGTLTFTATATPTEEVTVKVVILQ